MLKGKLGEIFNHLLGFFLKLDDVSTNFSSCDY